MKRKNFLKIGMMIIIVLSSWSAMVTTFAQSYSSPPQVEYISAGSIFIDSTQTSNEDKVLIYAISNPAVDIGDGGITLVIQVDYTINCQGAADHGYVKATLTEGGPPDEAEADSGEYETGTLEVSINNIQPYTHVEVELWGKYTDYGFTIDENSVETYHDMMPPLPKIELQPLGHDFGSIHVGEELGPVEFYLKNVGFFMNNSGIVF